jgi:hypothetical protein
MMRTIYLFPGDDFKFRNWSQALSEVSFKSCNGGKLAFIWLILRSRLSHHHVIVYYRYLNVNKVFIHEFFKLILDCFIVSLAICNIIEIRWIIHNVDKESKVRYTGIVNIKRYMLKFAATKFYVTSESLKQYFPWDESKLDVVSFGREYASLIKSHGTKTLNDQICNWKYGLEKVPTYIGLVTCWTDKEKDSFSLMNELLGDTCKGVFGLIYLGDKTGIDSEYLLEINTRISYYLKDVKVDFVIKTLSDKSVPYTLYSAATAGIPLITTDRSHFSLDLDKFQLGGCAKNYAEIITIIQSYDRRSADSFLNEFSWEKGANTLIS